MCVVRVVARDAESTDRTRLSSRCMYASPVPAYRCTGLSPAQCYFLLSASDAVPLLFYVEILRQGRTYATLSVKAVQNGRVVFTLLCSFKVPEPGAREFALPMPRVPPPEQCVNEEQYYERLLAGTTLSALQRQHVETTLGDRRRSPIDIALAGVLPYTRGVAPDGTVQRMFWMRAKAIPKLEVSFQKVRARGLCAMKLWPTTRSASSRT